MHETFHTCVCMLKPKTSGDWWFNRLMNGEVRQHICSYIYVFVLLGVVGHENETLASNQPYHCGHHSRLWQSSPTMSNAPTINPA